MCCMKREGRTAEDREQGAEGMGKNVGARIYRSNV